MLFQVGFLFAGLLSIAQQTNAHRASLSSAHSLAAVLASDHVIKFEIYVMIVNFDYPPESGAFRVDVMTTIIKPTGGLEAVVAASSAICYLDGERGVLAYCGHDIHDLARYATFEEVCHLLWYRRLPTRAELGDIQSQLVAGRPLSEPVYA